MFLCSCVFSHMDTFFDQQHVFRDLSRRELQEESFLTPDIMQEYKVVPGQYSSRQVRENETSSALTALPHLVAPIYYHINQPGCMVLKEENTFCGMVSYAGEEDKEEEKKSETLAALSGSSSSSSSSSDQQTLIPPLAGFTFPEKVPLYVKTLQCAVATHMPQLVALPFDGMLLDLIVKQVSSDGSILAPTESEDDVGMYEFKFLTGNKDEVHETASAGVSRDGCLPLGMAMHPPPRHGGDLTYCSVNPLVRFFSRGFYCSSGIPVSLRKEYQHELYQPAKHIHRSPSVHRAEKGEKEEEETDAEKRKRVHEIVAASAMAMPVLLMKTPLSTKCAKLRCFFSTWVMRHATTHKLITNKQNPYVNNLPPGSVCLVLREIVGQNEIEVACPETGQKETIPVTIRRETWVFELDVWPKIYLPLDCHGYECGVEFPGRDQWLEGLALPLHLDMNMHSMFGDPDLAVYEKGPVMHLTEHPLLLAGERIDKEDMNVSLAVNLLHLEEKLVRFARKPFSLWLVPKQGDERIGDPPEFVILTLKQRWTKYAPSYTDSCIHPADCETLLAEATARKPVVVVNK